MIIKNKAIVEDDWTVLRLSGDDTPQRVFVAPGKGIVPLDVWLAQRDTLKRRADLGVWLASSDRPESLQEDVGKLPVIAIDFPKFADGRGYSIAYILRERLGYKGELRAIGDVLRDQLFYMPVSYTHLRAHETDSYLVCRLLLEKKKKLKPKQCQ